jgi:hypothetical protein
MGMDSRSGSLLSMVALGIVIASASASAHANSGSSGTTAFIVAQSTDTYSSGRSAPRQSRTTGTQGVEGNPNCPPPNTGGSPPKNWSCKSRNRQPPPGIIHWNELDGITEGSAEMENWCRWYFNVARTIQKEFQLQLAAMRSDAQFMSMVRREGSVTAKYQIEPAPSSFDAGSTIYTISNISVPQTPLGRVVGKTLRVVGARTDILAFPPTPPRDAPVIRTSTFRVNAQGGPPQYDQRCRTWIAQQNP